MDYGIRKQLIEVTFVVGIYLFQSKPISCNHSTAHFGTKTSYRLRGESTFDFSGIA